MGEHRAFGQRLGAAGVDDLGKVTAGQFDFGRRRIGQKFVESNHAGRGRRLLFRRQPNQLTHFGVERGRGARDIGETRIGRQKFRPGVPQDERRLFGLEHEVDRDQNCAEARQRKPQSCKGVRVARQNCDTSAFANPARAKAGGEAVAHGVEFCVAPYRIATNNGRLVRKAPGAPVQQIRECLAAKRGVHRALPGQRFLFCRAIMDGLWRFAYARHLPSLCRNRSLHRRQLRDPKGETQ